jgi:hypothetical protein
MDEALKQLHDLHLPAQPGFWPPAPGWWVLAAIGVVLLVWLGLRWHHTWQRRRPFRLAIRTLDQLLASARQNETSMRDFADSVNALLKRALIHGARRSESAPLTGGAWLAYLDKIAANDSFSKGSGVALGDERFTREFHSDAAGLHAAALHVLQILRAGKQAPS